MRPHTSGLIFLVIRLWYNYQMKILGIETSCDETAASVVEDGRIILSNTVVSQIDIHQAYGGVVPEIAARSHIEAILPVIQQSLDEAQLAWDDIDAISVSNRPGLLGSLLIGTLTARTLALLKNKPLYGIDHLKAHVYANWLLPENGNVGDQRQSATTGRRASSTGDDRLERSADAKDNMPVFPAIALLVSGGHTQILYLESHTNWQIIGSTRDDAVGEAFDKVAKILGLPYPGGPSISKAAENSTKTFPLPTPHVDGYDFSFSGLKTAVLRAVQNHLGVPISFPSHELAAKLTEEDKSNFAASFQNTAIDYLVSKLSKAIDEYHPASVLLAGGVSANTLLREKTAEMVEAKKSDETWQLRATGSQASSTGDDRLERSADTDIRFFVPQPRLSTDNAAMVASAAFHEIRSGRNPDDPFSLDTNPTK